MEIKLNFDKNTVTVVGEIFGCFDIPMEVRETLCLDEQHTMLFIWMAFFIEEDRLEKKQQRELEHQERIIGFARAMSYILKWKARAKMT